MTDAPDPADLDAKVREQDPDRWLASRFISDDQARRDVIVILAFDHELARAPRVASNALLGEIRLTWWREALDETFGVGPVRRHPVAQALADVIRRRGLAREDFEAMIEARYRELDASPMSRDEAHGWARQSAGSVAVVSARILDAGTDPEAARAAGAAWMLGRASAKAVVEPGAVEAEWESARRDVRRLSVAAFPAAAHGALARARGEAMLGKQLRLLWAVARGRI